MCDSRLCINASLISASLVGLQHGAPKPVWFESTSIFCSDGLQQQQIVLACCRISDHREAGAPEQELFLHGTQRLWDRCSLSVHFSPAADVAAALAAAACQVS